jgi:cytochrome P450
VIARREAADAAGDADWLGMMMAARDRRDGSAMSHRELIDEVMSIIVAGHETTAAVLNAVWYLLSQHPEVEAKLHAEVDATPLADLSLSTLDSLHYTQQVINEALRLYPPVWVLTRRCVHAQRLAGYQAPAGTDVFMSPYVVQRDPQALAGAGSVPAGTL